MTEKQKMYYDLARKAVIIRLERGENFMDIMKSYPRMPKSIRKKIMLEFAGIVE